MAAAVKAYYEVGFEGPIRLIMYRSYSVKRQVSRATLNRDDYLLMVICVGSCTPLNGNK